MKLREWWVVQTNLSYVIGEPVYRVQDEEPSELDKRTSVAIHKVVELPPGAIVIEESHLKELEAKLEIAREAIRNSIARSDDYGDSYCSQPIRKALERLK